jgi:hypothetical protein
LQSFRYMLIGLKPWAEGYSPFGAGVRSKNRA